MKNKSLPTKEINKWIKFTQIGLQMAVTIAVCAFFGVWLDEQYPNFNPLFSVALSLFGVLAAMYVVIRQVLNMTDEKP